MKIFYRSTLKRFLNTAIVLAFGAIVYAWSPHAPSYAGKQTTLVANIQPSTTTAQVLGEKTINVSDTVLVTKVVDGDTVEIETGEKVRYIGIDTPETVHPKKAVQCFGQEASKRNKELVAGKQVRLVKDVSETDRYGRLLRYVYLADGTFINLKLVAEGYARVDTFPPDVAHAADFVAAARAARLAGRGLWAVCN